MSTREHFIAQGIIRPLPAPSEPKEWTESRADLAGVPCLAMDSEARFSAARNLERPAVPWLVIRNPTQGRG